MDKAPILTEEVRQEYPFTTYLVGAMQNTVEKDDGSAKREYIEQELLLRDVYPINPVKLEKAKTGMDTESVKNKMEGWLVAGKRDKFKEVSKHIWLGEDIIEENQLLHKMGDVDYVLASDWITFIFDKGDKPCGSYMECGIALEHKIPIYIISDINKTDLPRSLLQAMEATDGEVFPNFSQYLDYLDQKYKIKRQKDE